METKTSKKVASDEATDSTPSDIIKFQKSEQTIQFIKTVITNFERLKSQGTLTPFQKMCIMKCFDGLGASGFIFHLQGELSSSEIRDAEELGFCATIDKVELLDLCECGQQNICVCDNDEQGTCFAKRYIYQSWILAPWMDSSYRVNYGERLVERIYPRSV